jgi:hypothetical protein
MIFLHIFNIIVEFCCMQWYLIFFLIKNRSAIWFSLTIWGYISKGSEINITKRKPESHVYCLTAQQTWYGKSLSSCKQINEYRKIWFKLTVEYCSEIKEDEILSFAARWIKLEDIMLNEISQTQEEKWCVYSFICGS